MLRRVRRLDRVLLLVGVPIWLVCFGLSVRSVLKPAGALPLRVTLWQAPDAYPEVVRLADFVPVSPSGARVGDLLIRLGETDLRGASGVRFFVRFTEAAQDGGPVPALVERDGKRIEVAIPPVSFAVLAPMVAVTPIFVAFGIAILLKAPRSEVARGVFHLFLVAAIFLSGFFGGPWWLCGFSLAVFTLSSLLVGPLLIRLALVFPTGVSPASPWLRALPYPFAMVGLSTAAMMTGFPYSIRHAEPVSAVLQALSIAIALTLVHRSYLRTDAVARRQLKLSLLGLYLTCLPMILGGLWLVFNPDDRAFAALPAAAIGLGPIFVYLALYHYDVFDVDRLVSATAAYNVVLVLLAGAWLLLAPRVGEATTAWLGVPAGTGRLGVSLVLAVLLVPAQRYVRPRLEALLFKQQHALESGLASLVDDLSQAEDARALLLQVGRELHALIAPESTVIYGRDGDRYGALFVEGRAAVAELPADGPVLATLRRRRGPLCAQDQLAGAGERSRDPFAQASLEVLNAAVLLPIAGSDPTPATLVSLGPKRSGDLYTSTEIHLLRSVADRAALELQGFDERAFREESRAMQEAMRRYVPGAIAESIERGEGLESREREVTVLFVDIRGYTNLAQGSGPRDIFSTVNRYTRAVSKRVRDSGGTVVEFNGDGMMAVFGAPADLSEKERAAVRAGWRILDEIEGIEHDGRSLSVGIGIATGPAYVGNIQAADRLIWSAIGNTTNLAARLQSLTRSLDAAILLDAPTFEALGAEGRAFRRHEAIRIRGRSERLDVFGLPLSPEAPARSAAAAR